MAEAKEARVRIVSQGNSSRAAASRVYLNDEDITYLVRGVKVFFAGNPLRLNAELTLITKVDIDISAQMQLNIEPVESQE